MVILLIFLEEDLGDLVIMDLEKLVKELGLWQRLRR
jgi:hypothetical protein